MPRYRNTDATQNDEPVVVAREHRLVELSVVSPLMEAGAYGAATEFDVLDVPVVRNVRQQTVRNLQDYVQSQKRQIRLETDDRNSLAVISILDSMTDRVVREIPSNDFLAASCGLTQSRIKLQGQ